MLSFSNEFNVNSLITFSIYPPPSNVCSEKAFLHPYGQKLRQLLEYLSLSQINVRWLHASSHGSAGP